ncbi:LmeA family phospholipid-binding protein [Streptomyces sp. ISL-43]|uniref:LmeA family phospholipid-binding protein n=1 Tax=Streptomyces sp. ISL-43 TaxID=2819183 RepID=UPI001BEA4206|nr:LmeA family phospholipid-binding protein [Streptomyces sp. ISL-43]MBT2450757.1 LmeA family phospholipid-binding protein [Streptomyces sp. ISL-43]
MIRRRTLLLGSACALTLAVAAVAAADAYVEGKVERRVSEALACRLDTDKGVDAELEGTLAGLGALTGTVGTVRVTAGGVHHQGTDFDFVATLRGVSTDGRIDGGSATATVAYGQLAAKSGDEGQGMELGTDGSRLTVTGGAGGLPVTVVADLSTTANSVTITPATVSLLGRQVPVETLSAIPGAARIAGKLEPRTVEIPDLPEGARLTGAHAGAAGLVLDFALSPGAASSRTASACGTA